MKAQLIALLKKLNLIPADKENEIVAEIDKLDLDKKPDAIIDPSKITDPALKAVIEGLENNNAILSQRIKSLTDALATEKTQRDNAIKVQQEEAKKATDAKVAALVAQALKDGKIVKAGEADFKTLAETNYTFAENWLKSAPVDKSFKPEPKKDADGKTVIDAKPTSMRAYVDNRSENTQELVSMLSPSKN